MSLILRARLLLAGLLRYGRSKSKLCPNFMDKSDCHFSELSGVCESVSRQLRKDGVGASVKHAAIITPEEEDIATAGQRIDGYLRSKAVSTSCVFLCW